MVTSPLPRPARLIVARNCCPISVNVGVRLKCTFCAEALETRPRAKTRPKTDLNMERSSNFFILGFSFLFFDVLGLPPRRTRSTPTQVRFPPAACPHLFCDRIEGIRLRIASGFVSPGIDSIDALRPSQPWRDDVQKEKFAQGSVLPTPAPPMIATLLGAAIITPTLLLATMS